jgi:hypothetical protein
LFFHSFKNSPFPHLDNTSTPCNFIIEHLLCCSISILTKQLKIGFFLDFICRKKWFVVHKKLYTFVVWFLIKINEKLPNYFANKCN